MDIVDYCFDFLNEGILHQKIMTNIILIPKMTRMEEVGQFGPINMGNLLYEMMSNLLARRLKLVYLKSFQKTKVL